MKLCVECGTPCEGSRCPDHKRRKAPQPSATARGYGHAYQKLRARAVTIQPWCSDCLASGTPGNPITLDHTPASWHKVGTGKTLTLRDVRDGLLRVRCLRCNIAAGNARGQHVSRPYA